VSDFAFRSIEPAVERQAAQYAFDNPVTIEQLKKGAESGVTAEDFIPVGGTLARDTIRKLYGAQAQVEFHSDLVAKHTDITRRIDSGEIADLESLNNELRAPIDGAVKSLASLDPAAAIRLQASASQSANTAYKHGVLKFAQDATNLASITSDRLRDNLLDAERTHMNTQFKDQSPRDVRTLYNERVDASQVALYRAAAAAGDSKGALQKSEEHKLDVRQVLLQSFAENASSADHLANMDKIRDGDFGHMKPLWNTLTPKEKISVGEMVAQKVSSRIIAFNQKQETQNQENERAVLAALINGDRSPAAKALVREAYMNKGIPKAVYEEHKEPSDKKPTQAQELLYLDLRDAVVQGRNIPQKDKERLTPKQFVALRSLEGDTQARQVVTRLNQRAGDSGGLSFNAPSIAKIKLELEDYRIIVAKEINNDGTPKYQTAAIADEAFSRWRNSVDIVAAKKTMDDLTEVFKKTAPGFNPAEKLDINVYIERQGIDDDLAKKLRTTYKRYQAAKALYGPE
jgi:hypothetical protein